MDALISYRNSNDDDDDDNNKNNDNDNNNDNDYDDDNNNNSNNDNNNNNKNNNSNLTMICRMLYVCMYVRLLMKGSLSFDPNNAKFTQNIHESTRHVNSCIRQKSVQNWLKSQFFKKGSVYFKLRTACFS